MGNCASDPAKAPPQSRVSQKVTVVPPPAPATSSKRAPSLGSDSVSPEQSAVLPVKVFKGGQEVPLGLVLTDSGQVKFLGAPSEEAAQKAFADIVRVLKAKGAEEELQSLQALASLDLQVKYPLTNPFIGKLVFRPLSLSDLGQASSTYLKLACESDRSRAIYTQPSNDGSGDLGFADSAAVLFIILHSTAVLLVKVRDDRSKGYLAQVAVPVKTLQQGSAVQDYALHDPHDKTRIVCRLQAEVSYTWLRNTRDDGNYEGSSTLTLNRRRMRKAAIKSPLEYISQVNHWMLSHDNVWPCSSSSPPGCRGCLLNGRLSAGKDSAPGMEEGDHGPEDGPQEAPPPSPAASLLAKSGSMPRNTPAARWHQLLSAASDAPESARQLASNSIMESSLMDALGKRDTDTADMAALRQDMLALMSSFHERTQSLERACSRQNAALQELFKATSGPGIQAEVRRDATAPFISGHFEYGLGRAAAKRNVFVFVGRSQDHESLHLNTNVTFLGVFLTDGSGVLKSIPVPPEILAVPGHYSVVGLLPDDHTFAKGSLFILTPGTQGVVFDVDGTLTVGDVEVVTMFAIDSATFSTSAAQSLTHKYDLKQRKGALHCVRAWAAKGYQPIYLSGRQGSYFNLTQEWLVRHKYPPGPIHLTRTHLPTLPIYYSVGNFKVDYMSLLTSRGLTIYAAYGNTPTDIRAYAAHGIPKERTFIIGPHGGKQGTVAVTNFTNHNPSIFDFPDPAIPVPYTELLINAMPGYRKATAAEAAEAEEDTEQTGALGELEREQSLGGTSDAAEIRDDEEDEDAVADVQTKLAAPFRGGA